MKWKITVEDPEQGFIPHIVNEAQMVYDDKDDLGITDKLQVLQWNDNQRRCYAATGIPEEEGSS